MLKKKHNIFKGDFPKLFMGRIRGEIFFVVLLIVFVFSISFASANAFNDFFNKLFGKKIYLSPGENVCYAGGYYSEDGYVSIPPRNCIGEQQCVYGSCVSYAPQIDFGCYTSSGSVQMCQTNQKCINGACVSSTNITTCTDSDNGINYFVGGIVNYNNTNYLDACTTTTNNVLIEYSCSASGQLQKEFHQCQTQSGETCPTGGKACVVSNQTQNATCTDSDGGLNYWVKGIACKGDKCETDYCQDEDYLFEADCGWNFGINGSSHSGLGRSRYHCPSGYSCNNGACVKSTNTTTNATCTDSDGGLNYYVKGNVSIGSSTVSVDFCHGDGITLDEEYCYNSTNSGSKEYICPNGCSNGACVQSTTNQTANYIIERNIDNFVFTRTSFMSDWSLNSCEFFEFDNGIESLPSDDACINELGDYYYNNSDYLASSPADNVEVLIEVHRIDVSRDNFDRMVRGIFNSGYSSMNYETFLGKEIVILQYEENNTEALTFLWQSRNKIVGISLVDNQYLDDSDLNNLLETYFNKFPSTLSQETCIPRYYCEISPTVCPQNGIQTKFCEDFECNTGNYEEELSCSPGACAGCELEGTCIPYGFRKQVKIYNNNQGTYNLYCEMDGELREQNSKDSNGNWATCQNNYECESNVCSSGECIEVADIIGQAGALKKLFFKVACKIFNPISDTEYNKCLINFLGSSSGGGGSSP